MLSDAPMAVILLNDRFTAPENHYICNELRGIMARSTQFPNMITRSTIIYEIVSPGAAGSSIYI